MSILPFQQERNVRSRQVEGVEVHARCSKAIHMKCPGMCVQFFFIFPHSIPCFEHGRWEKRGKPFARCTPQTGVQALGCRSRSTLQFQRSTRRKSTSARARGGRCGAPVPHSSLPTWGALSVIWRPCLRVILLGAPRPFNLESSTSSEKPSPCGMNARTWHPSTCLVRIVTP